MHSGKAQAEFHTVLLSFKVISDRTREQINKYVWVSTPINKENTQSTMQQNKIRKESSISSQVKWVLLSIFTDHKRFKEQISHASWGDQTELNNYEVS